MSGNLAGRPVLVGVDGSDTAMLAVRWAAAEAARRHLPVRLVYAAEQGGFVYGGDLYVAQDYFDALEAEGRRELAAARAAIGSAHPDLEVGTRLSVANPAALLIEESATARMVVLGARGLGGFTGLRAGSNAVAVAMHAHCPVAVIHGARPDGELPDGELPGGELPGGELPGGELPGAGPVVVGIDGSPASEAAVAAAFDEASVRGVALRAVHTWTDYSSDMVYAHARQFMRDWQAVQTRESELLAERLAGWQEKYPDVTVQRVVTRDRPARCLVENSADAQLLVVGSRGRGGFAGLLLGSTSHALIHHATCPLLVVRPVSRPGGASTG
jgi:nucleotide-binding universal stress UspA family protein